MAQFNENEASRLFRPLAFDNSQDLFLCDDTTVGFSFLCTPIAGWNNSVLSSIQLMLSQDEYPTGSLLSFTLWASPDIKSHLKASDDLRLLCKDALMMKAHNASLGFMWGGTEHPIETRQLTKARNFQLLVTFKMPISDIEISEFESEKAHSIQRLMKERLIQSAMNPIALSNVNLTNIMNSIINWGKNAEWKHCQDVPVDSTRPLNEQFVEYETELTEHDDGLTLGNSKEQVHLKMLTAKRLPRNTQFGAAYKWFGDPFDGQGCVSQNFIITTNISFLDQNKTKGRLEAKKSHYIKSTFSALTQFAPKIKDMKADLEEITSSFEAGEKAVSVSISAGVFGRTEEEAADGVTKLQSYMRQAGLVMVKENAFALPSFINMLPFGQCSQAVKTSKRYFTLSTKYIPYIIPVFSEWKGTRTPTLSFVSRTGQVMSMDLFDSETNFNTLIYAESGSGKSFLTNEIIRAYLSTGNKAWAIDAGESYKKLSASLDGNFTAFEGESEDEAKQLSCNPFTMIPENDPKAFRDSLEMLAGCILAMAFTSSSPTDLQASEVERILLAVWNEKGRSALIDDVADACKADSDQRVQDIGKQLYAFTTKGQFGHYFDKPHNIEFTGNFNVLELDGLSKTPRLQAVVLFMLIVQISHSMYEEFKHDRSIKRLVIIDEAWDLLANSMAVAEFMEKGFRRFRKYNGAGIVVTQSINDLQKTDAGKAIAENAANSLILKQKESTIASVEKDDLMSIGKAGYRLLKKIKTQKGHYSEIFFNTNQGMGIGRLIVDPLRILMYSTTADDNKMIDDYVKRGYELQDAMAKVVEDKRMLRFKIQRPEFLNHDIQLLKNDVEAKLLKQNEVLTPDNVSELPKAVVNQ